MEKWLDEQREGEWGALKEHTDILKNLIREKVSAETAAKELVESVMSKETPSDAAYRFAQLVLKAAAEFQATQEPIVALLKDIRKINHTPNKALVDFNIYLRDQLDSLHERRYFSESESGHGLETSPGLGPVTPGDRWVNYNAFFANLVLQAGFAPDGAVFGFFCLRDILEYSSETLEQKRNAVLESTTFKAPPIPKEKLIEYDIMASVRWVSSALYNTQNADFGDLWARGIAVKTDFWTGEPGLSEGRWQLWKERFEHMAERDDLHQSVNEATAEAAAAIGAFGKDSHLRRKES